MGFLKVIAYAIGRCVKEGARIACALVFVALAPLAVRAETFDLLTFTPPPGARAVQADAVSFTDATPTTFAVSGVYRSAPGSGDPARDFADEWNMLVARSVRVDGELKTETVDWPGGWKLTMGAASVSTAPFLGQPVLPPNTAPGRGPRPRHYPAAEHHCGYFAISVRRKRDCSKTRQLTSFFTSCGSAAMPRSCRSRRTGARAFRPARTPSTPISPGTDARWHHARQDRSAGPHHMGIPCSSGCVGLA
jgi:hypothetical protein